jgi:hypothetical protein
MITHKTFCSSEKENKNIIINNNKYNNVGNFSFIELQFFSSCSISIYSVGDEEDRELIASALMDKALFERLLKSKLEEDLSFKSELSKIGLSLLSQNVFSNSFLRLTFSVNKRSLNLDLLLELLEQC